MSQALFIAWIALLGADRINLLHGVTPFVMTPFLALTPVVALSELLRRLALGRPLTLPRATLAYASLCCALIGVVAASVIASSVPATSAARVALLAAQVAGTLAVAVAMADRDDAGALLARGAAAGLAVFVVFNAFDLAALLGAVPETLGAGPVAITLKSYAYAGIIPRLAGPVLEPNRAGLLLIFYAFVVAVGEPRAARRRNLIALAAALLLITLSRSAAVAAGVTLVVLAFDARRRRVPAGPLVVASAAIAGIAAALAFSPDSLAFAGDLLEPLAQRLSLSEGSSRDHLALLARGLAEGTESVPRIATGMGYGSAYTSLQDFFPGNRYGSFHSLYVTMFAESGVFAVAIIAALLAVPLSRSGRYRALIAGVAVFNVFQNAVTEPAFWLILALAWSRLDRHVGRVNE